MTDTRLIKRDSIVRHEAGVIYEIASDIDLIAPAVQCMLDAAAAERPLDWETRLDIAAALAEAFANAILHGNRGDRTRSVLFTTEVGDDAFVFRIRDEGEGFDPAALPDRTRPEELLDENGRGILLMRHYMSEVRFRESGRVVELVKSFGELRGA